MYVSRFPSASLHATGIDGRERSGLFPHRSYYSKRYACCIAITLSWTLLKQTMLQEGINMPLVYINWLEAMHHEFNMHRQMTAPTHMQLCTLFWYCDSTARSRYIPFFFKSTFSNQKSVRKIKMQRKYFLILTIFFLFSLIFYFLTLIISYSH
jgi:hypothetical protein